MSTPLLLPVGTEWLILGAFFFLLPIIIAIKFPLARIAMGIIQIIVGLLLVVALGWLFGIGIFIGAPLLFFGIILVVSGVLSKQKQLRTNDYERGLGLG